MQQLKKKIVRASVISVSSFENYSFKRNKITFDMIENKVSKTLLNYKSRNSSTPFSHHHPYTFLKQQTNVIFGVRAWRIDRSRGIKGKQRKRGKGLRREGQGEGEKKKRDPREMGAIISRPWLSIRGTTRRSNAISNGKSDSPARLSAAVMSDHK